MKPLTIAVMLVVILAAGIYIGTTGLVSQYAVIPGRSSAGTAICSPDNDAARIGTNVKFTASNLPANAPFHWSSDDGRSSAGIGTFTVQFSTAGAKTVSLFYFDRNAWLRTTCQVQIR